VNTTASNTSSDLPGRHNRLMAVMLPALLMIYVAVPLAVARK
jgi:hypothetical protein